MKTNLLIGRRVRVQGGGEGVCVDSGFYATNGYYLVLLKDDGEIIHFSASYCTVLPEEGSPYR